MFSLDCFWALRRRGGGLPSFWVPLSMYTVLDCSLQCFDIFGSCRVPVSSLHILLTVVEVFSLGRALCSLLWAELVLIPVPLWSCVGHLVLVHCILLHLPTVLAPSSGVHPPRSETSHFCCMFAYTSAVFAPPSVGPCWCSPFLKGFCKAYFATSWGSDSFGAVS